MSEAQDRIRTLLLRGDNLLKSGRPERLLEIRFHIRKIDPILRALRSRQRRHNG